jgi:hypothetical protein
MEASPLTVNPKQWDVYGNSDRPLPIELVAPYSDRYKHTETRLLQNTGFLNIVSAFSTD